MAFYVELSLGLRFERQYTHTEFRRQDVISNLLIIYVPSKSIYIVNEVLHFTNDGDGEEAQTMSITAYSLRVAPATPTTADLTLEEPTREYW